MQISTPGVVIRDHNHEDSRVLTILTKTHGVVTAFAPSANRPKNPLASSTELFCYSDFVLFRNKGNTYVNNADSIETFFGLRADIVKYALASYFAQLTEEIAPKEESSEAFLSLFLSTLHYLETDKRPMSQLKSIYELRLLTMSGYMPNLVGCRVCNEYEKEKMYFISSGELICSDCLGKAPATGLYPISLGVLAAMRHILYSEMKKIFSFTLPDKSLKSLEKLSETYLLYELEKSLPTLEFYRSVKSL